MLIHINILITVFYKNNKTRDNLDQEIYIFLLSPYYNHIIESSFLVESYVISDLICF